MAQLYPHTASVTPGDVVTFHVSSATPRFRILIFHAASLTLMASPAYQGGFAAGLGPHDADWGWPGFAFPIPANWRSGVYLALCVENGAPAAAANPNDPATRLAQTIFVVRSAKPGASACILYKLPLFTYAAYNPLADPPDCFYISGNTKVTLRRPGNGEGAVPWDSWAPDHYDPGSFRQTFSHWDLKFIHWLEANKYDVDYCTDMDVHQNPQNFIANYRLILSVGHDEYWSEELRNHLEAFIEQGGNVAFFSGNVCWWRVRVVDGDTAIECDKAIDQWWSGSAQRPENSVTGVSFRNAGGQWTGQRPALGYTVQHTSHWVFDGVKRSNGAPIQDGDIIGDGQMEALVGYECDGAALLPKLGNTPRVAASTDGTPPTFLVLGVGEMIGWEAMVGGPASTATMGLYTRGGTVFNAATTDWARLLAAGHAQVDRITRNVLDKLKPQAVRIVGLKGACSDAPAVEGASISFHADTSGLPNTTNLSFAWTASAGASGATNSPHFQLQLPSPPVPVTVTVAVDDGTACAGFGTLTFTPMTAAEYEHAKIICEIRKFVITSAVWRGAARGVRDRISWLVDPLYDPIKGYVGNVFQPPELRRLLSSTAALEKIANRLLKAKKTSRRAAKRRRKTSKKR